MGRMSPLHNPAGGLTPVASVAPASRNGGASNAAVNGATNDIRGKRGIAYLLHAGAITGAGNYKAYLQTNDLPTDPTNGNWANVNATLYPSAQVTVKTNADTVTAMEYMPGPGMSTAVRAVLVVDANIVLAGISGFTF